MRFGRVSGIDPFGGMNFCLERLHNVTISHDVARSYHWYRSDLCCLEHTERSASVTVMAFLRSPRIDLDQYTEPNHPLQIFYMISQFSSGMTDVYINWQVTGFDL